MCSFDSLRIYEVKKSKNLTKKEKITEIRSILFVNESLCIIATKRHVILYSFKDDKEREVIY